MSLGGEKETLGKSPNCNHATRRATCSNCRSSSLKLTIDLGNMPLANALLKSCALEEPEPKHPLDLYLCLDCSLLQVGTYLNPVEIFTEYPYFSSFSDTMLHHACKMADELSDIHNLDKNSLVVEIASNDGYLLQYFDKRNIPVIGVEPAHNVAKVARAKGIETVCEFFNTSSAAKIEKENGTADLILSLNVFAHVPEIGEFVDGVKTLLNRDGVWIIETPYVGSMIEDIKFDTIYHEHNYYYSLSAIHNIIEAHDLVITDFKSQFIHGGSLRVSVMHQAVGIELRSERVAQMLEQEQLAGMLTPTYYSAMMNRVDALGAEVKQKLQELKNAGNRIAGYGAGAKGAIFLNYFDIGQDLLEFVADRSTYKQGRYMPGSKLPIRPAGALTEEKIDYCLVLTWNFLDEIVEQLSSFSGKGGKFIVAIPKLQIL